MISNFLFFHRRSDFEFSFIMYIIWEINCCWIEEEHWMWINIKIKWKKLLGPYETNKIELISLDSLSTKRTPCMSGKLAPPALVKEIDADKKNMIYNTVLWRLTGWELSLFQPTLWCFVTLRFTCTQISITTQTYSWWWEECLTKLSQESRLPHVGEYTINLHQDSLFIQWFNHPRQKKFITWFILVISSSVLIHQWEAITHSPLRWQYETALLFSYKKINIIVYVKLPKPIPKIPPIHPFNPNLYLVSMSVSRSWISWFQSPIILQLLCL